MKKLLATIASLLFITSPHTISSELDGYAIPDTEVRNLRASSNGKDYRLYIKLPRNYHSSDASYPLVVVNDARYSFPIVASLMRRMGEHEIQDAIVVGISYSGGDSPQISRTRDYTPTHSPNERLGHSKKAKRESGGAEKYVEFLANKVLPHMQGKYRVNQSKTVFVGHSFGGLLGTYILFHRPQLFDLYIIGSPSLWYDNQVMFDTEQSYAKLNNSLPVSLYMATGELEESGNNKMVSQMLAFEKQLGSRHYAGLSLKAEVLANETHLSSFPVMVSNGLRWGIPAK